MKRDNVLIVEHSIVVIYEKANWDICPIALYIKFYVTSVRTLLRVVKMHREKYS